MTDISIGAGFVTSQAIQPTVQTLRADSPDTGGSFMQSLKQSDTIAGTDTVRQNADTASTAGTEASASVSAPASDVSAETDTVSESVSDSPDTYNSSEEETEAVYRPARDGGYAAQANVRVEEETVKELSDLSEKVKESIGASKEKPLLRQSEEALENALLKAFRDLNDPEKKKEELDEKELIFLMKLVDKITARDEKKTALSGDKDEDEEKLGGTLLQIIDTMLKNAEKEAEESGAAGAQQSELISDTNFVDIGSSEDKARESIRLNRGDLKMEHFVDPDRPPEDYRLPDPMRPRTQGVPTVSTEGSEETASKNLTEINNGTAYEASGSFTEKAIPVTEKETAAEIGAAFKNTAETADSAAIQEDGLSKGEALVKTEAPVQNAAVSYGNADKTERSEIPANVPKTAAEEKSAAVEELPAGERIVTRNENQGLDGSYTGRQDERTLSGETQAAAAEAPLYGEAVKETAVSPIRETEKPIDTAKAPAAENVIAEKAADTAEIPESGGRRVNAVRVDRQDFKAVVDNGTAAEVPIKSKAPYRFGTEVKSSELDELARLFGIKRERVEAELPEAKENDGDTKATVRDEAPISVPVEEVSVVNSKTADIPIVRPGLSESGVKQVVTQIVSEMLNNLPEKDGETTLMMTLNPESLGRISVKLVENAGKLSVTVTAESRETAAILASRAESVQESMRDSGTQLEKYQVVYGAEQDGRAEQQNYDGSSKNPYVRQTEEHDDENDGQFAEILSGQAV